MSSSPYSAQKVTVLNNNQGFFIGGQMLFSVSTSIQAQYASAALTAYANQYEGRKFPVWIKDNRLGTPSMSFTTSPIQSNLIINNVGPTLAQIYFTLNRESDAGQVIRNYIKAHDMGYSGSFPYTLFWDVSWNYISATSMSINTIGFLLDYDA